VEGMQYILLALMYFGEDVGIIVLDVFRISWEEGVGLYEKSNYYLICTEKLVRS
jgi:hypothetical protein